MRTLSPKGILTDLAEDGMLGVKRVQQDTSRFQVVFVDFSVTAIVRTPYCPNPNAVTGCIFVDNFVCPLACIFLTPLCQLCTTCSPSMDLATFLPVYGWLPAALWRTNR